MMNRKMRRELAKYLVVANSSSFIIDIFRAQRAVAYLCHRGTASLLRTLKRLTSAASNDFEDRAYTYGILVALYLKRDVPALERAMQLDCWDRWYVDIAFTLKTMLQHEKPQISMVSMQPIVVGVEKISSPLPVQLKTAIGSGQ